MICRFPVQLPKVDSSGKKFFIYVPCGHCAWCLRQKRNEWFVRMLEESKHHLYTRFVTLDYRDEDLPYDLNHETGELVPCVSYRDIELFHKRLRKNYKFRFFLSSEYGKHTNRPHYHAIYWSDEKIPFYDLWSKGEHGCDLPAKVGSFKYVTKYILKGSYVPAGAIDNFHVMSRRPGIGVDFCDHVKDNTVFYRYYNKIMRLPQYYRRKFMDGLSPELRSIESEKTLDYMSSQPLYDPKLMDLFYRNAPDGQTIHDFISDLYRSDFLKQIQINSK